MILKYPVTLFGFVLWHLNVTVVCIEGEINEGAYITEAHYASGRALSEDEMDELTNIYHERLYNEYHQHMVMAAEYTMEGDR